MNPYAFEQLRLHLSAPRWPGQGMRELEQASRWNFFTAGQVEVLLAVYSRDNERLRVLSLVGPRLLERGRARQLLSAFHKGWPRAEARRILRVL
jgi:hypothetical protein